MYKKQVQVDGREKQNELLTLNQKLINESQKRFSHGSQENEKEQGVLSSS